MTTSPLPSLPFWRARSFWLGIFTLASTVGVMAGYRMKWLDPDALSTAVMSVMPMVTMVMAYFERRAPTAKLALK